MKSKRGGRNAAKRGETGRLTWMLLLWSIRRIEAANAKKGQEEQPANADLEFEDPVAAADLLVARNSLRAINQTNNTNRALGVLAAILVAAGLVGAVMIQARWWALGAPIAVLVAALWAVASAVEPRKSLLVPSIDEQENLLEIYASETHKIHQLKAREQSKRAFQMHCDLNKEGRDLKAAIVLLKVSITLTLLSVLFHVFI